MNIDTALDFLLPVVSFIAFLGCLLRLRVENRRHVRTTLVLGAITCLSQLVIQGEWIWQYYLHDDDVTSPLTNLLWTLTTMAAAITIAHMTLSTGKKE